MSTRCKACDKELFETGKIDELCHECLTVVHDLIPEGGDEDDSSTYISDV
jgi:hypothetical protein